MKAKFQKRLAKWRNHFFQNTIATLEGQIAAADNANAHANNADADVDANEDNSNASDCSNNGDMSQPTTDFTAVVESRLLKKVLNEVNAFVDKAHKAGKVC